MGEEEGVEEAEGAGEGEELGMGVEVGAGVGVALGEGVEAGELKFTLGLLLFGSVTVKLLVVSFTVKVSVPAFEEPTLNVA